MKAIYRCPVKPNVLISVPPETKPIVIDGVEIGWKVDEKGYLTAVEFAMSGGEIRLDGDAILRRHPELQKHAYKIAVWISNSILLQTGVDAFSPAWVLHNDAEVFPEGPDEERVFQGRKKWVTVDVTINWSNRVRIDPSQYPAWRVHSAALASYADGLRSLSLFTQYEQAYKVVEYFFGRSVSHTYRFASPSPSSIKRMFIPPSPRKSPFYDAVSEYAKQHNLDISRKTVRRLRRLRNRCVHHKATLGHANPEDLDAVREVEEMLPVLRRLTHSLLTHPPTD